MEFSFPFTAENLCKDNSGLLKGIKWVGGQDRWSKLRALSSITNTGLSKAILKSSQNEISHDCHTALQSVPAPADSTTLPRANCTPEISPSIRQAIWQALPGTVALWVHSDSSEQESILSLVPAGWAGFQTKLATQIGTEPWRKKESPHPYLQNIFLYLKQWALEMPQWSRLSEDPTVLTHFSALEVI